jgi:hypothetical protein
VLTPWQEAELITREAAFRREVADGLRAAIARLDDETDTLRRATADLENRTDETKEN